VTFCCEPLQTQENALTVWKREWNTQQDEIYTSGKLAAARDGGRYMDWLAEHAANTV